MTKLTETRERFEQALWDIVEQAPEKSQSELFTALAELRKQMGRARWNRLLQLQPMFEQVVDAIEAVHELLQEEEEIASSGHFNRHIAGDR